MSLPSMQYDVFSLSCFFLNIPAGLGVVTDDTTDLLNVDLYQPDIVLRISPSRIGVILFLDKTYPEADLVSRFRSLLYEKQVLKQENIEIVPVVILACAEDFKLELINSGITAIKTAEKLTNSQGDMNHLIIYHSGTEGLKVQQQLHNELERIFLEDSFHWDRVKKKYLL